LQVKIIESEERYKRLLNAVTAVTEFKESDTEDSFIRRADDAMYEAKNKGRNRVEVIV